MATLLLEVRTFSAAMISEAAEFILGNLAWNTGIFAFETLGRNHAVPDRRYPQKRHTVRRYESLTSCVLNCGQAKGLIADEGHPGASAGSCFLPIVASVNHTSSLLPLVRLN